MAAYQTSSGSSEPPQTAATAGAQSSGPRSGPAPHTRTYQACIPCRRRKVRCDLGPVDNPHDPPCTRCRRESKECYFSATRRKRKTSEDADEDDGEVSDYEVRNGRKKARPSHSLTPTAQHVAPMLETPMYVPNNIPRPLTPGGSLGRPQPLRRPTQDGSRPPFPKVEDDDIHSPEPQVVLQDREVFNGHDALNLLFEAAGRNGDIEQHHRTGSSGSMNMHRPRNSGGISPGTASLTSPRTVGSKSAATTGPTSGNIPRSAGPDMTYGLEESLDNVTYQKALRSWSRLKFVRGGLFTAQEGIAYIDYFYEHLSPLTPIIVPDYQEHSTHPKLLADEPVLLVTLLTITSRYMKLPGPGSVSRPYQIHMKLWDYLQSMLSRLIWGQEQFGGGFCGAGGQPSNEINPLTRKGLRTLGAVESLMLLTEWHPRALHFPPNNDDDELLLPDQTPSSPDVSDAGLLQSDLLKGVGGGRIDAWLEPCWRSDRICWMLLGIAMSLAFEIGVFNEASDQEYLSENISRPVSQEEAQTYIRRKNQLKTLLVVYSTQTSGRLGLTAMLPRMEGNSSIAKAPALSQLATYTAAQMTSPSVFRPAAAELMPQSPTPTHGMNRHAIQDRVVRYWSDVAKTFEAGNLQLFATRRQTRELISSGRYVEVLEYFRPILHAWRREFDSCTAIPPRMRCVLIIEIEYSRVYINSLALQAVIDRCTHNAPKNRNGANTADGGAIPFSVLQQWTGNDRQYVDETIEGCRTVLSLVVDHLLPNDALKHAPVRTFFRIVSVAIILLKTFALGASERDVSNSLGLMDRASEALAGCIVDDVHVGNRFAELLSSLTQRIKNGFVRLPSGGGNDSSRGATPGSQQVGREQTPMMPPPPVRSNSVGWTGYTNNHSLPMMGSQSPSMQNISGWATPNNQTNPLYGISTETYDPTSNNAATIVPPPTYSSGYEQSNFNNVQQNAFPFSVDSASDAYDSGAWLALPLDNLVNSNGADVTQTAYGTEIGGYDMLDVLLAGDMGPY
ncbi:hypothetical protein EJ05DRAFT_495439 [Pseudovirgaria hyperparasitica]|uniref:Zn(2)-C6 fungal-type domain-containing protein n=1 Tax=Pseudovirgaria hyperparasitica TaxID=470096 RepID=A0A6A6WJU4_9PEZI|nr:uncharacterized protein EJ05DRAFT_495439 [Pseudovirgaria hyperparasitica]KAF2762560.1 hypothetical protein EJ05DRAFT_495439 [Pseudovirgaria hyperparasitica]